MEIRYQFPWKVQKTLEKSMQSKISYPFHIYMALQWIQFLLCIWSYCLGNCTSTKGLKTVYMMARHYFIRICICILYMSRAFCPRQTVGRLVQTTIDSLIYSFLVPFTHIYIFNASKSITSYSAEFSFLAYVCSTAKPESKTINITQLNYWWLILTTYSHAIDRAHNTKRAKLSAVLYSQSYCFRISFNKKFFKANRKF